MTTILLRTTATKGPSMEDPDGFIFFLDAIESETPQLSATATKFPVEDGGKLTDHIIEEPETLTLVGPITNSPENDPFRRPDRDFAGFEELEFLITNREPLTVVTPLRTYLQMALVSVGFTRDATTGQMIVPSLDFEKIRTSQQQTAQVPARVLARSVRNSGTSEKDKGRQSADEANPEKKKKGKGILVRIFGGGG